MGYRPLIVIREQLGVHPSEMARLLGVSRQLVYSLEKSVSDPHVSLVQTLWEVARDKLNYNEAKFLELIFSERGSD
jgi:DNA-binding XRE family transcriptional regulator